MAYDNSGKNEDMFSDTPDEGPTTEKETQSDEGDQTALLPSSICPGMKPGDELTLKIKEVQEDQYLVEYESGNKEDSESESEPAPVGKRDKEMDSMMS